jgi:hypothetical protein
VRREGDGLGGRCLGVSKGQGARGGRGTAAWLRAAALQPACRPPDLSIGMGSGSPWVAAAALTSEASAMDVTSGRRSASSSDSCPAAGCSATITVSAAAPARASSSRSASIGRATMHIVARRKGRGCQLCIPRSWPLVARPRQVRWFTGPSRLGLLRVAPEMRQNRSGSDRFELMKTVVGWDKCSSVLNRTHPRVGHPVASVVATWNPRGRPRCCCGRDCPHALALGGVCAAPPCAASRYATSH